MSAALATWLLLKAASSISRGAALQSVVLSGHKMASFGAPLGPLAAVYNAITSARADSVRSGDLRCFDMYSIGFFGGTAKLGPEQLDRIISWGDMFAYDLWNLSRDFGLGIQGARGLGLRALA